MPTLFHDSPLSPHSPVTPASTNSSPFSSPLIPPNSRGGARTRKPEFFADSRATPQINGLDKKIGELISSFMNSTTTHGEVEKNNLRAQLRYLFENIEKLNQLSRTPRDAKYYLEKLNEMILNVTLFYIRSEYNRSKMRVLLDKIDFLIELRSELQGLNQRSSLSLST